MAVYKPGSYEERECARCLSGLVYDGQAGGWIVCELCSGTGHAMTFIYPKARRLRGCASCGGRFLGRDLFAVMEDHMTFFEGDELCRSCAVRHGVL